jgi:hypothetical protein
VIRPDPSAKAFKGLFPSKLEYLIYRAVLCMFPNYLVIPNMALNSIFKYDEMKSMLAPEDFKYYLAAGIPNARSCLLISKATASCTASYALNLYLLVSAAAFLRSGSVASRVLYWLARSFSKFVMAVAASAVFMSPIRTRLLMAAGTSTPVMFAT